MPQQTVSGNRGDDQLIRRLQQLTGTDQILLNDRDYMSRLHERLEEEYSRKQTSREKKLSEEEIRRIRRLKREGVIDDSQYQEEMAHIQHFGVGSERLGNATAYESRLSVTFPLLTDGTVLFYDNPDATSYRGFIENKEEVQCQEKTKQDVSMKEQVVENAEPLSLNDNENVEVSEMKLESNAESSEHSDAVKTSVNNSPASPRCSRPQSVSIEKLNSMESVADMFTMAKSMVFIETGLNPAKRKGGK